MKSEEYITIPESGINFGPYEKCKVFYIEKSELYRRIGEGVKVAEFLLLQTATEPNNFPTILIIEAKSSFPAPPKKEDDQTDDIEIKPVKEGNTFDDQVNDIRTKFINALMLFISSHLKNHSYSMDELPKNFKEIHLDSVNFEFKLVMNRKFKESWLPPVQHGFLMAQQKQEPLWKIWGNLGISVISEARAKEDGLIIQNE